MITEKHFTRVGIVALAIGIGVLGYKQLGARADGIPGMSPMTYAGTLENASGPVTGVFNLRLTIYDVAMGGDSSNIRCVTPASGTSVNNGRFQIVLDNTCTPAVRGTPDLWLDIEVNGGSIGRTKISAVPFAVEAGRAAELTPAASNALMPAGMIGMFTGACPTGWTLCDGTNGTPDFRGAYPKGGTTLGARMGSNVHQHGAGMLSAASGGAVTPTAAVSIASAGAHTHVTPFDWDSTGVYTALGTTAATWRSTHRPFVGPSFGTGNSTYVSTTGIVTDQSGAHSHPGSTVTVSPIAAHGHSITGQTDTGSSEPVNVTLAFCMRQ